MYELTATYTIEEIDASGKKKFLLTVNDKPYYVGELVYLIIRFLSEKKSTDEMLESLNIWSNNQYKFTKDTLFGIIEQHIKPLGLFEKALPEGQKKQLPLTGIQGQWTLVKFEHLRIFLEVFKYAFHPVVFTILFIGSASVNYFYVNQFLGANTATTAAQTGECLRNANYVLLFYPLAFMVLFFHEMGHAAASYMYGVKPKNIGFGFYLALPVLYADITGVWKLNRWKRTIINLGGIYMQLLINTVIFYVLRYLTDSTVIEVLMYIIILNMGTVVINLNPFFRFDGYWIYSDLFNLPNLRKQSNVYLLKAIKYLFPKAPINLNESALKNINLKNPFLIVYSVLKYAFFIYIAKFIVILIAQSIMDLGLVFSQIAAMDFSICAIEFYAKTFFSLGVITYFSYKYTKVSRNYVRNIRAQKV
ncbi:MAG: hypothetical protein CMO01_33130 [Thalassobius sp.]|nr:hypothetical protein [Thalassovita sp.]